MSQPDEGDVFRLPPSEPVDPCAPFFDALDRLARLNSSGRTATAESLLGGPALTSRGDRSEKSCRLTRGHGSAVVPGPALVVSEP
jgi:hypothetical protein